MIFYNEDEGKTDLDTNIRTWKLASNDHKSVIPEIVKKYSDYLCKKGVH